MEGQIPTPPPPPCQRERNAGGVSSLDELSDVCETLGIDPVGSCK